MAVVGGGPEVNPGSHSSGAIHLVSVSPGGTTGVPGLFFHQSWESNSGPQAYTPSTLPTGPSSKSPDTLGEKKKLKEHSAGDVVSG